MVPPCSDRVTRVPPYSISRRDGFRVRGCHPLRRHFPEASASHSRRLWAVPVSLIATRGISVDFCSSGYLDISVPRVRLVHLCVQCTIANKLAGFPHSDIPGSKSVCRLPEAYRRLRRPSSPSAAKAFTRCACSLDHITQPVGLGYMERFLAGISTRGLASAPPGCTTEGCGLKRMRPETTRDGTRASAAGGASVRRKDAQFHRHLDSRSRPEDRPATSGGSCDPPAKRRLGVCRARSVRPKAHEA